VRAVMMIALLVLIAGCATTRARFVPLGDAQPPRGAGCDPEIFRDRVPGREFSRVSRIDVHMERTLFRQPSFQDAIPELRRQACLSGAEAVVDIEEREGALVENRSYHVTGFGVKYRR
jgi:hypothetical protein